jgi:hypothetical protein
MLFPTIIYMFIQLLILLVIMLSPKIEIKSWELTNSGTENVT